MTMDTITLFLYYPISILLSFVFPSLFNLFKNKYFHSLFNLTTNQSHSLSSFALVTANADAKIPNITEVTIPPTTIGIVSGDVDVDGLISCTESLGFESSDERRVSDRVEDVEVNSDENDEIWRRRMIMKKAESRANWIRSFPPPLPSLNRNGKPSFYLRPVRKDGRLELTEVKIHRPDILHASRHDGRLTLRLIPDPDQEEEEENEEEDELVEEEQEEEIVDDDDDEEEEIIDDDEEEEIVEEEEEERGIRMVVGNSNEGLKRCHEMVNQQHLRSVHGNHLQMCGISIV